MKTFTLIMSGVCMSIAALSSSAQAEIISAQPDGTERWMHGYSYAYGVSSWGYADNGIIDGIARHLVYAEDGTVYLENPVTKLKSDSWIKGTQADGKISFNTPQTIKVTTDKDGNETEWTVRRLVAVRSVDDSGKETTTWVPDTQNTAVTFNVTDDKISMEGGDDVMLGVCIGDEFYRYGDSNAEWTYVDEHAAVIPEGAEVKTWTLTSGPEAIRLGTLVEIAEVDGEMIIKGFWEKQPAATIKGKIEGNKLRIPSGQYVGFLTKSGIGYYTFVVNAAMTRSTYLDYYNTLAEDKVFTLDRTNNTLTPDNEEHSLIVMTGRTPGYEYYKYEALVRNPSLRMNTGYGAPLPPSYTGTYFYSTFPDADVPFVALRYTINNFDEYGNGFRAEDLRYSVWVDGTKFLFDPDDAPNYEKLPAPTEELTLDFTNNWGMTYSDYSIFYDRGIQVATMSFDKIGIQTIYVNPVTGEKTPSLIAYYYPETGEFDEEAEQGVGVDFVGEDSAVVSTSYYDITGNRVDGSYKGICIKTEMLENGKIRNTKVLKR